MKFLVEEIEEYSAAHTEDENALLKSLNRETHAHVLSPRMLSGHMQGRFLSMISRMIRPDRILEIGTYTGYSGICLCEGLNPGGKLITIDVNEELESFTRRYFDQTPFKDQIDYRIGNALDIIPTLTDTFDIVFIDADKINYSSYFNLCLDKTRTGGFLIADNVLWSGKVVQQLKKIDKDTQALLDFNRMVHEDPRVSNLLLPIRDGLMILQKL
ncbi:putative O-methyltransferase YrrM [Dyadobacter sp. BE34]|uniref:O-methyltransferase YrrM n=1 Tax=Dyadobacter fermentans TaxID=94254 RepID=A0ABU1R536_9BACT|nr:MULTISPECIES: O-methyltransferase [Dyadobacter]MDR6808055.1 putative O-methyltransferase YrrM [Dyadobacter fermentans]MDR7046129.1 putative O-methyltransferase YrrM [Dyadobacter sp. BE242]MDR7200442.1 putative O-methyltransferase YrrM [Dyadobacter sp. BE34]MDR7218402.1 putative O-methyltransferase YrrM [Dyadobacter sp. BE31]MDR7266333.1 putative O-methyltransferase YrrM [Dyadobacter sp. BE32]